MPSHSRSVFKGLFAGAVGGAIGTVVLNQFQRLSLGATRLAERKGTGKQTYTDQQQKLLSGFEKAHVQTATHLAHAVGQEIPPEKHKQTAPIVEYAFGIVCAGVYGAIAEYVPSLTAGFGTVYGAALFTGASEIVLPAIGFVPPPAQRTPVQHIGGLAGNVVYGASTEGVRRLVRRAL